MESERDARPWCVRSGRKLAPAHPATVSADPPAPDASPTLPVVHAARRTAAWKVSPPSLLPPPDDVNGPKMPSRFARYQTINRRTKRVERVKVDPQKPASTVGTLGDFGGGSTMFRGTRFVWRERCDMPIVGPAVLLTSTSPASKTRSYPQHAHNPLFRRCCDPRIRRLDEWVREHQPHRTGRAHVAAPRWRDNVWFRGARV